MCTQRLLRAGADPDTQYEHPEHGLWTPLHGASYAQNQAEVAELTEHGASAAVVDKDMQTPLHVAAANGSVQAAKVLIRRGASPAARDGPLCDGMLRLLAHPSASAPDAAYVAEQRRQFTALRDELARDTRLVRTPAAQQEAAAATIRRGAT